MSLLFLFPTGSLLSAYIHGVISPIFKINVSFNLFPPWATTSFTPFFATKTPQVTLSSLKHFIHWFILLAIQRPYWSLLLSPHCWVFLFFPTSYCWYTSRLSPWSACLLYLLILSMVSSSLLALNIISWTRAPKLKFLAYTSLPNFRLNYLTMYLISPLGYLQTSHTHHIHNWVPDLPFQNCSTAVFPISVDGNSIFLVTQNENPLLSYPSKYLLTPTISQHFLLFHSSLCHCHILRAPNNLSCYTSCIL